MVERVKTGSAVPALAFAENGKTRGALLLLPQNPKVHGRLGGGKERGKADATREKACISISGRLVPGFAVLCIN